MLLQPLVENAIRHGLEPKLRPVRFEVAGREENGQLVLTVRDNGVGLTGKPHGAGVGLVNVRERLATLFGSAARLDLVETPPAGLTAQLWIPRDTTAP
jgi:LytS/YehU family sensor histidine kinase